MLLQKTNSPSSRIEDSLSAMYTSLPGSSLSYDMLFLRGLLKRIWKPWFGKYVFKIIMYSTNYMFFSIKHQTFYFVKRTCMHWSFFEFSMFGTVLNHSFHSALHLSISERHIFTLVVRSGIDKKCNSERKRITYTLSICDGVSVWYKVDKEERALPAICDGNVSWKDRSMKLLQTLFTSWT